MSAQSVMAQTGWGRIAGGVFTEDEKPAAGVTVTIVGTEQSSVTSESGKFSFNRLAPGNYTLRISLVGYKDVNKETAVAAGKPTQVTIVLDVNAQELGEVVIVGRKSGLNAQIASGSLRTQTPLLELPQNVQVVTGKALADQQIISTSDGLLRNISGAIRSEHWGDLYANVNMRGSQVQAFRNGFNVVASFWGPLTEDMSVVDRVEVVKGPAGFMLGTGDPSGLYNVVTKKPTGENRGEVSFTTGSYDLYRGTIDIDRKLSQDGKLLFRFNGAYQKKGSFRPFEHNDRISIAPVLSYAFNNRSKLTVEYNLQHANMTDVGSYYVFSPDGFATLPRNFTLAQPGTEPTKINDHNIFANFQHSFSNNWKLTVQGAYFYYGQVGGSSWPAAVGPGDYDLDYDDVIDGTLQPNQLIRSYGIWDARSDMKLGQAFVNGEVNTGAVRHRILAGIDAGKKDYKADWLQYHEFDTGDDPFDIYHPDYGTPPNGFPEFDRITSLTDRAKGAGGTMGQEYISGYVQDELGFFKNTLRITLAGRYGYLKQYEWGGDPYEKKHFTPRAGVSYSIGNNTAVYVLYDQAFIPQAGILRSGKTVKPITGNNMEIGFKRDWFDGKWNTTLAAYRILKQNELTADPSNTANESYSIVIGEKEAKGFEFDLKGEILPGFTAVANYAFTEGKVTKVADGVTELQVGDLIPVFAKHTSNAWLSYTIQRGPLKGLGINGGFTYLGNRVGWGYSATNPERNLPDYFKIDGGLFWQNKKISVTANVFNILDKYLYSGAYYTEYWNYPDYSVESYSWQAEPPRNLRLTVAYRF
ncbi:MAG: TonB-dependent receptor [Chitinophagaceae bacterium]|nr:TonB-dependent receptor [Chitinophagaceae bacterium]